MVVNYLNLGFGDQIGIMSYLVYAICDPLM